MAYTLGQAARAVGRSKTTLGRAIKSGRISATRSEDGRYLIDPAELSRVFTGTDNGHRHVQRFVTPNGAAPAPSLETVTLHQLLAERERLVAEQAETIRQLWQRLDVSETERRRLTLQLAPPAPVPDQPRPLGRRILRWLARQHWRSVQ
jgi:hypothetical protein